MNDAHRHSGSHGAPGGHATTDLPLQAQLMGSLALVLLLSAIAGVIGYATFDSSSLERDYNSRQMGAARAQSYHTSRPAFHGGGMRRR